LVFWNGSENSVSEVAKALDKTYLQVIGADGQIGFSREINAVDRDYIRKHYEAYGDPMPPCIRHQGIDDAFVEKASVVHYYYLQKWLKLKGAD
jgi:hypothetical protein